MPVRMGDGRKSRLLVLVLLVFVAKDWLVACKGDGEGFATGWQAAQLIETDDTGDASSPHIALDPSGKGQAVWAQSDGIHSNIWANRYSPSEGWATAGLLETDDTGNASSPQIALDAQGNGLAVWRQYDGISYNIWANRYTQSGGWELAELIENDDADPTDPEIALDTNGNGLVVWSGSKSYPPNLYYVIMANRYTPAGGWETDQCIFDDFLLYSYSPRVAMDANGNGLAVWHTFSVLGATRAPPADSFMFSRYTPEGGWEMPHFLNGYGYQRIRISLDANGNGMAVMIGDSGILARRYTPEGGWEELKKISNGDSGTSPDSAPQIALDPNGDGLAVWSQSDGTRSNIWSSRYTQAAGWELAELVEIDDAGDTQESQVVLNARGDGLAVWSQSDGTRFNIWANRYTSTDGWEGAELIETDDTGDAVEPQLALSDNGYGVAVWSQSDGTRYNIWANTFIFENTFILGSGDSP